MVKDALNNFPMNMVGLAHTSREILKNGDVQIFLVVLSTLDFLHFNYDCTGNPLSTF